MKKAHKSTKRKVKTVSLDAMIDRHIGKTGTPKRDAFEKELRADILGSIIKIARTERLLTQNDLGKLLGVKKGQISKLENNTKDIRISTFFKALEALNAKIKFKIELESKEKFEIT